LRLESHKNFPSKNVRVIAINNNWYILAIKRKGLLALGRSSRRGVLKTAQKCSMGFEVRKIGWEEEQLAPGRLDQPLRRGWLVEPTLSHDYAGHQQFGQQYLLKIDVHHLRVATILKSQWRDQFTLLRGCDNAGAFPPLGCRSLVNPLPFGCPAPLTMQAVVHAAFIQVKNGPAIKLFKFAREEPPLHLVALAIFDEFFDVKLTCPSRTQIA
jgi:hypothetical protein